MQIYIILFGIAFAIGLFFILADVLKLPTIATEKAIINMGNKGKVKVSGLDVQIANLSTKLAKFIKLDEYKEIRLKNMLIAGGINKNPQEYTANCIVKALLIGIWTIPSLLIFPLIAPVFLIIGILTYFKEYQKADELLKGKREKIETELPRFVATITQELKNSRDVLKILDNYKHSASKVFAKELDMLTADMRSGGYETALTRFEAKINSPLLSDIVRGLISVLRGDNAVVYFEMLSHDMKQLELQKLKQVANKIPAKIRKYSFVMLMCFLGIYLTVLIYQLITSMSTLF